jgi:hypothetical protein
VGIGALQFNVASQLNVVPQGSGLTSLSIQPGNNPAGFSGTSNGTPYVTIPLTVSTNGGSISYGVSYTGLSAPSGATVPACLFTIGTTNGNAIAIPTAAAAESASTQLSTINLYANNTCATGNGNFTVPGTYSGNVTFTPNVSGVSAVNLPFSVTVGGSTTLTYTGTLNFAFTSGSTSPSQQSVTITPGGVATSVTYTASIINAASLNSGSSQAPSGMLSILSGATGTVSNGSTAVIVVQANPTGVAAGSYQATLLVNYGTGLNQNIPITVFVGNGVVVTPTTLNLSAPQGYGAGQNTATSLSVTALSSSGGTVDYTPPTVSGLPSGLLTITNGAGTANGTGNCTLSGGGTSQACTYSVGINTGATLAGTYTGNITVAPNAGNNNNASNLQTITVPVTVTVTAVPTVIYETAPNSGSPAPITTLGLPTAIRGANGSIPDTCTVFNVAANGGTSTVTLKSGVFSTSGIGLYIAASTGAGQATPATQSISVATSTTPAPIYACAHQTSASTTVGAVTANITATDAFGNTTTLPVSLTVTSGTAGEIAVFRQSNTGTGGQAQMVIDANGNFQFDPNLDKFRLFGLNGDIPVAGDWYGTGQTTIGVFRQGVWVLDIDNNGVYSSGDKVFFFGLPGDIPVTGDWNGDGRIKFGVFRCASPTASNCAFILDYAGKMAYDPSTAKVFNYGLPGDKPVAGRWNPSSPVDQIGVYRCPTGWSTCYWVVNSTGTGSYSSGDQIYNYGLPGDIPIVGNWFGSGVKRIGVFRSGTIVLNISGTGIFGTTDFVGSFGLGGDYPVVGSWSGPIITNP